MFKHLAMLILLLAGTSALAAEWQLMADQSRLHFLSTKNTHVVETHRFDQLSGGLDNNGNVILNIGLASVNTGIEIRDQRMRDMLFNVGQFAQASFSAELPAHLFKMEAGQSAMAKIGGELDLHGQTAVVEGNVIINKISDTTLVATTVQPVVVNAALFGLNDGILALQQIAGLMNIGQSVPVTFSLTFERQ